jgi:hypothetical protein
MYNLEVAPEIEYEPIFTSFQGIDGLKPAGTKISFTKEMLQEWYKCYSDPLYFISNYYYIVTLDNGIEKINLWDFQEDFIKHIHENRFSIILASRQVGKSIITIGYILWYILFQEHKEVAVLSKTAGAASEIMGKLKRAYMKIPQWLAINVVGWAGTSISLENGCHVSSQATTENAGRSASANILFLDEFAFVPTNIATKFYSSAYPIISNSKTSKVIICSTPNGHNHFYTLYDKAKKGENYYKVYEIFWNQVPGRDEEWKKMTISNLALEKDKDGEAAFAQEYELQFENTSLKTLISASTQRYLADFISKYAKEISLNNMLKEIPSLKVFETPIPNNTNYFLIADTGNGVGGDYSSFLVIKVDNEKYEHVATYNCNTIMPIEFAEIIDRVSKFYNNAYILVENNGPGIATLEHLWYTIENENMINLDKKAFGLRTTQPVRNKGITKLKEYLEYNILNIYDIEILQEVEKFVRNPKTGKFEAELGYNDDLVMCLILFCYLTTLTHFDSYLNTSTMKNSIDNRIHDKIMEENPYLINYDKILGESGIVTVISNEMLGYRY